MLRDAQAWGMQLVYVSREEYRRREQPAYIEELRRRFGPCLVVPEGGANAAGVQGCKAIAELLPEAEMTDHKVVLAVGTGTTLAGVAEGLGPNFSGELIGISVLKGAFDLDSKVAAFTSVNCASWKILHDHHCGGYARVSPELREFILAFEEVHKILLDPVYTGKALYAVHELLVSGEWGGDHPIVFIHTGGVQGRRGFAWLS
jgi:1-aminocyclopropane-1-carboxylate deaminase